MLHGSLISNLSEVDIREGLHMIGNSSRVPMHRLCWWKVQLWMLCLLQIHHKEQRQGLMNWCLTPVLLLIQVILPIGYQWGQTDSGKINFASYLCFACVPFWYVTHSLDCPSSLQIDPSSSCVLNDKHADVQQVLLQLCSWRWHQWVLLCRRRNWHRQTRQQQMEGKCLWVCSNWTRWKVWLTWCWTVFSSKHCQYAYASI